MTCYIIYKFNWCSTTFSGLQSIFESPVSNPAGNSTEL